MVEQVLVLHHRNFGVVMLIMELQFKNFKVVKLLMKLNHRSLVVVGLALRPHHLHYYTYVSRWVDGFTRTRTFQNKMSVTN